MKIVKIMIIALVTVFTFGAAKAQVHVRIGARPVHHRTVVVHRPYHHRAVVVHRGYHRRPYRHHR